MSISKNTNSTIELYLGIGETEYLCEVNYDYYPGDPGRYTGPWENCYPAVPEELEINSVMVVHNNISGSSTPVNLDLSCLLDNAKFYDYVESEVYEYLEKEEEDYDESRYYNSVNYW